MPSVTFPLSNMFARLSSAAPSTTTTTAGAGATLLGTVSWQQNFNITPITDQFTIRNIGVLYRAVALCDPKAPGALLEPYVPSRANKNDIGYQVPRIYNRADELVPDPYYLARPNCVLCLKERTMPPTHDTELADTTVRNEKVFGECWLFHRKITDSQDTRIPKIDEKQTEYLGRSGSNIFYIKRGRYDAFAEFLILTLPISPAPTRFASIAGTTTEPQGKGKGRRRGPPKRAEPEQAPVPNTQQLVPGPAEGNTRPGLLFVPGIQSPPQ